MWPPASVTQFALESPYATDGTAGDPWKEKTLTSLASAFSIFRMLRNKPGTPSRRLRLFPPGTRFGLSRRIGDADDSLVLLAAEPVDQFVQELAVALD